MTSLQGLMNEIMVPFNNEDTLSSSRRVILLFLSILKSIEICSSDEHYLELLEYFARELNLMQCSFQYCLFQFPTLSGF